MRAFSELDAMTNIDANILDPIDLDAIRQAAHHIRRRVASLLESLDAEPPLRKTVLAECIALRDTWDTYEHAFPG